MTNFEKWKNNLTLQQFIEFIDMSEGADCEYCPAKTCCAQMTFSSCNKSFEEWGKNNI